MTRGDDIDAFQKMFAAGLELGGRHCRFTVPYPVDTQYWTWRESRNVLVQG